MNSFGIGYTQSEVYLARTGEDAAAVDEVGVTI